MATGTGKTVVAFQIAWKLWNARWNRTGEHRKPRILFLADRNILIDDPNDKTFVPFGDTRFKIEGGNISKSREMYFAIYQALAKDENRPGPLAPSTPDREWEYSRADMPWQDRHPICQIASLGYEWTPTKRDYTGLLA